MWPSVVVIEAFRVKTPVVEKSKSHRISSPGVKVTLQEKGPAANSLEGRAYRLTSTRASAVTQPILPETTRMDCSPYGYRTRYWPFCSTYDVVPRAGTTSRIHKSVVSFTMRSKIAMSLCSFGSKSISKNVPLTNALTSKSPANGATMSGSGINADPKVPLNPPTSWDA